MNKVKCVGALSKPLRIFLENLRRSWDVVGKWSKSFGRSSDSFKKCGKTRLGKSLHFVYIINRILHVRLRIPIFSSRVRWTLEDKIRISTCGYVISSVSYAFWASKHNKCPVIKLNRITVGLINDPKLHCSEKLIYVQDWRRMKFTKTAKILNYCNFRKICRSCWALVIKWSPATH